MASASNGSAIRRLNGAGNLRRSDSIRNRLQPRPKVPNYGGPKVGITGAVRSNFVLKARLPGTEFLDAETERKKWPPNARTPTETKIQEVSGRKSRQKRPIWRCAGNTRFCKDWMVVCAVRYEPVSPGHSPENWEFFAKFSK